MWSIEQLARFGTNIRTVCGWKCARRHCGWITSNNSTCQITEQVSDLVQRRETAGVDVVMVRRLRHDSSQQRLVHL